jgi:hypothetical protein
VSASIQNQALSALLFLYREVLQTDVGAIDQVPRARVPTRLPIVLSRQEVGEILRLHARPQSRRAWRPQPCRQTVGARTSRWQRAPQPYTVAWIGKARRQRAPLTGLTASVPMQCESEWLFTPRPYRFPRQTRSTTAAMCRAKLHAHWKIGAMSAAATIIGWLQRDRAVYLETS